MSAHQHPGDPGRWPPDDQGAAPDGERPAAQPLDQLREALQGYEGDDSTAPADPLGDPWPAATPAAGPAPAAPPGAGWADHTGQSMDNTVDNLPPVPGASPRATAGTEAAAPAGAHARPPEPDHEATEVEVRRFMTASDFLDRRAHVVEDGPATWGWRGGVRRWTGGLITPKRGPAEQAYERDRAAVQRNFAGPKTIAFINPKGGAAKTTGVLAAGFTFGTVRGGGVVAWDNNETRGTLGIRAVRGGQETTRELLRDLEHFGDVQRSRIGDLGVYVRGQGDAHFDVLASDERPQVTGTIRAVDFVDVHKLLQRFYRIILVDTGNNMRAENWLAAANAADLLVVTSTVREDTGYSGLWMLDALQESRYPDLKHKTITILSDPSDQVDDDLARDLVNVYSQRTRGVHRVPYDPVLVSGSVVPYHALSAGTRRSWLTACAAMASAL